MIEFWERLVGPQNVIRLECPEDTSESIGLTIGVNEGVFSVEEGANHLRKRGLVAHAVDRVTQAISALLPGAAAARPVKPDRPRRL